MTRFTAHPIVLQRRLSPLNPGSIPRMGGLSDPYSQGFLGLATAASRLDYNLRMLRWMQRYLQGPGGELPEMAIDYGK